MIKRFIQVAQDTAANWRWQEEQIGRNWTIRRGVTDTKQWERGNEIEEIKYPPRRVAWAQAHARSIVTIYAESFFTTKKKNTFNLYLTNEIIVGI